MTFGMVEIEATLNATCAALLVAAFVCIKTGHWRAHACTMIAATLVSAIFLACYLTYHAMHGEKSTNLHAHDWLRWVYLAVLLPHLLLAVIMLPMIFMTLARAWRRQWGGHRRMALPTFWIWLYVSFSGVAVYFLLYHTRLVS